MVQIAELATQVWTIGDVAREATYVVRPSLPILYFGNRPSHERPALEPILPGLGARYYPGAMHTALHTDAREPVVERIRSWRYHAARTRLAVGCRFQRTLRSDRPPGLQLAATSLCRDWRGGSRLYAHLGFARL